MYIHAKTLSRGVRGSHLDNKGMCQKYRNMLAGTHSRRDKIYNINCKICKMRLKAGVRSGLDIMYNSGGGEADGARLGGQAGSKRVFFERVVSEKLTYCKNSLWTFAVA